jgi:hypothetical protein
MVNQPTPSGYFHRRPIVIDATKVPSADQVSFPVLISGVYPFLATANGGQVQNANGYDIVFSSDCAGTNKLDHEIESYDPTTGSIAMWVRVPSLSHTANTVIYLQYGNPTITTSQENRTRVWDNNYVGVYHFSGSALSAKDSTANANNGSLQGTPSAIVGQIGNGVNFSGSSDVIAINSIPLNGVSYTISSWFSWPMPATGSWNTLARGSGADHQLIVQESNWHLGSFDNGTGTAFRDSGFALNTLSTGWHYVTAVGAGAATTYYIDGARVGAVSFKSNAQITYLGNYQGGSQQWGKVDEARISNTARSADWIATEFNNQNSPSTFYTILPENQTTVAVFPAAIQLVNSQTQQFTATVFGDCNISQVVAWSLNPAGVGSITPTGLYTAPASVTPPETVTVKAVAAADGVSSGSAAVTLAVLGVSVSPQTATLGPLGTQQFTATVTNAANTAVTWSLAAGAPGSIDPVTGVYTAPTTIMAPQTVTVTATSAANGITSANGTVNLVAPSMFTPLRINAGGPNYTDPQGRLWNDGRSVCGGNGFTFSTPPAALDAEYYTGVSQWVSAIKCQFPVPNMDYIVTLKFADPSYTVANKRVFDVIVNGSTVLSRLDVAGNASAHGQQFWDASIPVHVTTGQITIQFTNVTDNAIVNAVEVVAKDSVEVVPHTAVLAERQSLQLSAIVPGTVNPTLIWSVNPPLGQISATGLYTAPASIAAATPIQVTATNSANPNQTGSSAVNLVPVDPNTFVPLRINAGGPNYTDPQGRVWSDGRSLCGGDGFTLSPPPAGLDAEYDTGVSQWSSAINCQFTVPNMDYIVTLKFADPSNTVANKRLFDVIINGSTVVSRLDVAGNASAHGQRFWDVSIPVHVTAGQITIQFTNVMDTSIVNAIEVVATGSDIRLTPGSINLWPAMTQQFVSPIADPTNPAVVWSLVPNIGAVTSAGLYTAPPSITSPQSVTVTATTPDGAPWHWTASGTINLYPPETISISPQTATLSPGFAQQFNATITNNGTSGVTWKLTPQVGTISQTGLYTAPTSFTAPQTVTVTATGADGTSATATVNLVAATIVSLSPQTATLTAAQSQAYTATVTGASNTAVTWTISPAGMGAITWGGIYTAPATISATTVVTLTATSVASPNASSTAILTLLPPPTNPAISISPSAATLTSPQSLQLQALVGGAPSTAVNWSVLPAGLGTITSTGLYSSPSGITAPQTVSMTATLTTDTTKSATATITLSPPLLTGYGYRRAIVIDHTKVANTDQSNFPVLISGTYSYLATISNQGHVQNPNGYDIVFSSDCAGTQQLPHEIDSYNATDGTVRMWVLLSNVSHTTDTVFYLSYGNSAITASQENRPSVDAARYATHTTDWDVTALHNQDSPATFYTIYPENTNSIAPGGTLLSASETQQFTPLFTVGGGTTSANPLVLLGGIQTPSPAESLAVNGNLVYTCDDNEVSLIDVSTPAIPRIVATGLSPYIKNSGLIHCTTQRNALVAFSSSATSAIPGSPAFSAFDLTNPVQPQFIAATVVPRYYLQEPSYVGNIAFVPTGAFHYWADLPGQTATLREAYGEVFSEDITNFANPQLLGVLQVPDVSLGLGSTPGNVGPNTGMIFGASLRDPQTLYVAGSTAVNGVSGTGKLLVVDISNPAAMSVVNGGPNGLLIPGTVDLFTPVIQGNHAVALGDNGGGQTSFSAVPPATVGNIVVTTFDLTNPRSPAILKSLTTTYSPGLGGGSALIGPNLFLFGGVKDSTGNNVILLVDITDPLHPVLTPYPVFAPVTRMVAIGRILHVTHGAAGYAAYLIPGATSVPYTSSASCNPPVTWSPVPPGLGSISASGLYTAPANVSSTQTFTLTATNQTDPTQTAQVPVTISGLLTTLSIVTPGPYMTSTRVTIQAHVTNLTGTPAAGISLAIHVTGANQGTGATITDANGNANYTYTGAAAGADQVQATVFNGSITVVSNLVTLTWTTRPGPQISVNGEKQLRLPQTGSYAAAVSDPTTPGASISVTWTQTGGPAAVQIASPQQTTTSVTFPIPGVYALQITATDANGSSVLAVGPINVLAADTRTVSSGWLAGLDSPQLVTGRVPINLIPGETLTSGTLILYPVSNITGVVDLDPAKAITLNSNTTGSGTLATIDTTLLANGPYYILLQATDTTGKTMGSGMSIVVAGDYKPGRVTTAVTDLVLPAPGMPIQITRTYDSLTRRSSSDFGNGWSLGVNVQLSVAANNDVTLTIKQPAPHFLLRAVPCGLPAS